MMNIAVVIFCLDNISTLNQYLQTFGVSRTNTGEYQMPILFWFDKSGTYAYLNMSQQNNDREDMIEISQQ